jgi:hypothetical protein
VAQAVRAVWSEGEVQLAISELSDVDLHRLQQTARALARGSRLAPEELLNEAVWKLLDGVRKVPRTQRFVPVLLGAMRSLAWNNRKLHDNARVDSGDDEALNSIGDAAPTPEDLLARKNMRQSVLALFQEDEIAQAICEGWFFEQMAEKELCELTGIDLKMLGTKKQEIKRALIRSDVGAHLK